MIGNQLKQSLKEFNIYQLRPKSFTTQNNLTSSHKENTSKQDMPKATSNKLPLMYQPKVESELKLFTKLVMSQSTVLSANMLDNMSLVDKLNMPLEVNMSLEVNNTSPEVNTLLEVKLNILLEVKPNTPPANTPLESHNTPLVKLNTLLDNTLLEVVESEEKLFTEPLKLEVMLLEAVESDTTDFFIHYFI